MPLRPPYIFNPVFPHLEIYLKKEIKGMYRFKKSHLVYKVFRKNLDNKYSFAEWKKNAY